ncbi:MAG: hypothetical protein R3258_06525 [Acidimicrobiia bacterium]|nr:hypothetical protein [Acidimicrobiia bacterium]
MVLILTGTVWILQGFDVAFAPESFMTGDSMWVIWGVVAILIGAGVLFRHWKTTRS